jgi:glycosyltransferase involved in cell wall biosynthesis
MHGGLGGLTPARALERWLDTPHLLGALADRGGLDVTAVWRTPLGLPGEAFTRDGVRYVFVPDGPRFARRVAGAVAATDPDIVHVNGLVFGVPTLVLRARVGRRARIVVQHHGELPPARRRTRVAQRAAAGAVDAHLFTGGRAQAEVWYAARVLPRHQPVADVLEASTRVEPVDRVEARRATGMHGDPAIVWVGRLVEGKDPLTALAGFARFVEAGAARAQLWLLCSERTLLPRIEAAIEASPVLRDRVAVDGPVAHDDIATWLSAADLYLSTSRHEGSGYALIEALACGCPPVVTELPSHAAIAGDEGRRFPAGDVDALAVALRDARRGPAARSSARRAFEARLGWDAVVDQLLRAYRVCADGDAGWEIHP